MATRSMIGRQHADGTISATYCHWDGYPAHVGAILQQHYASADRIDALQALGALSELGPEIGAAHPFDAHRPSHAAHDPRYASWCLSFFRDRGDRLMPTPLHCDDAAALLQAGDDWGAEYVYLWQGSAWYVRDYRDGVWQLLAVVQERAA
mgnify:CR=1 FL=1